MRRRERYGTRMGEIELLRAERTVRLKAFRSFAPRTGRLAQSDWHAVRMLDDR